MSAEEIFSTRPMTSWVEMNKMKKPIIKLPQNVDELESEKKEAEERVSIIAKQESGLKQEYSVKSTELQARIRKLNAEVKKAKMDLNKFQRENRSLRRKLADERLRLTKGSIMSFIS